MQVPRSGSDGAGVGMGWTPKQYCWGTTGVRWQPFCLEISEGAEPATPRMRMHGRFAADRRWVSCGRGGVSAGRSPAAGRRSFGDGAQAGFGVDQVVQLGVLELAVICSSCGKRCISWVNHHEKRSARQMRARPWPNRRQAGVAALAVVLDQAVEQALDVGRRQVQALGAGGRHDVAGVAGQEHAAKAQRLGDEAAQRAMLFSRRGR